MLTWVKLFEKRKHIRIPYKIFSIDSPYRALRYRSPMFMGFYLHVRLVNLSEATKSLLKPK